MTRPEPSADHRPDPAAAELPAADLAAVVVALLAGRVGTPEPETGVNRWRRQRIAALRRTAEVARYPA